MKTFLILNCSLFFTLEINAQSVTGSAGTSATSSSGSMSWTVGEIMTETYSSSVNFFTQGFHQPDTSFMIRALNNPINTISVYPNPVVENVIIDFSASEGNCFIELFNVQGQLIRKEYVNADQKQLTLSFLEFANGIYLLSIIDAESNTHTSYKITKSK